VVESVVGLALLASAAALAPAGLAAGGAVTAQPRMGDPLPGLTPQQLSRFDVGKGEFGRVFLISEGLGPIYTHLSCGLCHDNPLGGGGGVTVLRFGRLEDDVFDPLLDLGGPILQPTPNDQDCDETVPPEANVTAERVTPGALGYGLVEAIPDADLLANETTPPLAGLSGRAHMVEAFEDPGTPRVGRFGWKSQVATILSFSADAARNELGITNRFLVDDPDPNGPLRPPNLGDPDFCDTAPDPEDGPDGEGLHYIDRVTHFQRYLAPPPQTPKSGMAGEAIFDSIGCTGCHVREFTTADATQEPLLEPALREKVVHAYSDFLLHDMGAAADNIEQGDASRTEIRTSPLWGLVVRDPMWHDGRFEGGTFESRVLAAIDEHVTSPEYVASGVGDGFHLLSTEERDDLVRFLGSLGRAEFDMDANNAIDLADFIAFAACFGNGPYIPDDACAIADIDQDGDVDLDDYAAFLDAYDGEMTDCNDNGSSDFDDIILGTSLDVDADGVPDDCIDCVGDVNGDGTVEFVDLLNVLSAWGPCSDCAEDFDGDGMVGFADLLLLLSRWGDCGIRIGACCLDGGACAIAPPESCSTAGGTYQGDGSDCGSVVCP
jgi:CxxC motif-containing protein (DUF1111 family)